MRRRTDERGRISVFLCRSEARVPMPHPLRAIREVVHAALGQMSGDFAALYARRANLRSRRRSCCGPLVTASLLLGPAGAAADGAA